MFGKSIKEARIKRGLTQRELAKRIDVSPGYLSKIENEKASPTGKLMEYIAYILKMRWMLISEDFRCSALDECKTR